MLNLSIENNDMLTVVETEMTREDNDEVSGESSSTVDNKGSFDSFSVSSENAHSDTSASESQRENISNSIGIVSINGFVSKPGIGVGRSDNDRQFIFCNGRPVDLPKFSRLINEV